MDSSWADSQLLSDPVSRDLPPELVLALKDGHGRQYLEALALIALQPGFLNKIFPLYEPLVPELAARWMNSQDSSVDTLQIISAFARILPLAPYLNSFTNEFLTARQDESFSLLSQSKQLALIDLDETRLHQLLLAVFRLLSYDARTFSSHVSPIQLQSLLGHPNRPIRYLAIRVFCLYMHAADSTMQDMLTKYLGGSEIEGEWEGIEIDYLFLSLWEEKRLKDLRDEMQSRRDDRPALEVGRRSRFLREDFQTQTAEIAGILLPRAFPGNPGPSQLVHTETTNTNRFMIAKGLLLSRPILVTGEAGCGKTALVADVAREMCLSSSLITLHLNEQTDAKMLLGTYTSTKPGSFSWQPGVLSRAVQEGRWLVLEDIDRAPSEVISVILPLLEKGELLIPSRKEHFRAPPGFRIIATMRTTLNQIGEEVIPGRTMLGSRLFHKVRVNTMGPDEVKGVLQTLFPLLRAHSPAFMSIFGQLGILLNTNYATKSAYGRSISVRDLVKFARRVDGCLQSSGFKTGFEAVSEAMTDEIFMHAVDCFAAPVAQGWLRSAIVDCIAREMQIAPQKVQYCLSERIPTMTEYETSINVGRGRVCRVKQRGRKSSTSSLPQATFANTRHALRALEQLAAAIQYSEPVLLVGETGIGKTALIQQLAQMTGQTLTVMNLSQQSESGDMLGGFKPVNIRSLAIPMAEEFETLFTQTFSSRKNTKYLVSLAKNVAKGNWSRAVSFWQEGLRMVDSLSLPNGNDDVNDHATQPAKKRKLDAPRHAKLKDRWMRFSSTLENLEMHLAGGGTKFAFSFVEGKIVKAVRNGEWVLLDEINLASPSTLESIADLFNNGREERPSLLLPDSGVIERIPAHENFRVFAAMNPATDAGKRDLFAGIRSRFTEIYVDSPDKELKDLLLLVKTYLGRLTGNDERAVLDIARLYMDTKQMAAENALTDGAAQKPHFSIRTLVRALIYVTDHAHIYGLRRALYEGFSMSFLTILSKASEQVLIPLIDRYVLGTHKNVRSLLGQTPQAPKGPVEYVQFKHYWMARGPLVPQQQPHYIITPFIERNLLNLVRASSTKRFPILLQGPTSSGKTSMIEYLSKISGNKFVRINNHEHTDLQEYLGSYASDEDGRLVFQEGILVQALRHGYWIVLDELNLAPTDVLEALNRLLDDNRELLLPETQEVIRPHPNFMLFATQNPAGLYGGRKVLSRAFRNRFLELHFDDIPEDELEYILQERSQIAPSFCTRIVAVYKRLAILRQSNRLFEQKNSFATLRDLFRWALREADNREQLAVNGYLLLAERVRNPQEKAVVKKVIEEVMKVNILEQEIYSMPERVPSLEGEDRGSFSRVVWTPAMRRLYTLVSRAIENNEPVLLIGETGCGKTQLCQALSASFGKHLDILNAHMNTEAGDLIGAQRPIRNRAQVEQQLSLDFKTLFHGLGISLSGLETSHTLRDMFSALEKSQIDRCPSELLQRIHSNNLKARSLFEWADGSLVNAMKAGHHFLLDEISLADDSVLERLNSVLEPHRTLLLAEKGATDSLVVAADGFQFLATMNPGGDYGKRELSAALRNRLTEIWVPSLTDDEDIIPILEAKIRSAPKDTARYMVSFCRWFRETFHTTSSSTISIRDLLAWVEFINHPSSMDPMNALIHGAAMVFIDTLGANPAAMVASVATDIEIDRSRCLEKLGVLIGCDASGIYHAPAPIQFDDVYLTVGPFSVLRLCAEEIDPEFIFEAPTTRLNTMRLVRAMQLPKPILLEGSPGVGKTTTIVALAHALGQRLTRINLSEQTDITDLFGNDVPVDGADAGNFAWRDAPFLTAMQKGEWVLLDEMNLASQSVLEGLNSCLDHRGEVYIAELDQTFSRHPDFKLFAAQNPHHQGGGRKGLPASFVNRFTVVFADAFNMTDLQLICSRLFPKVNQQMVAKLLEFVACLNEALRPPTRFGVDGAPWEVNLRDIIRWLKLVSDVPGDLHPKEFIDVILRQRFRTMDDKKQVTEMFSRIFADSPMQKSFYHNLAPNFYQVGHGILSRNVLSQAQEGSNLEIFPNRLLIVESLLLCVRFNWPCILVGPAGCGKSTVLNHLAAISGSNLIEIAMNPDVDTMDLVGGFEQVDPQRQLSVFLETIRDYAQNLALRMAVQADESIQLELLIHLMRLVSSTNPKLSEVQHILVQLANDSEDEMFQKFVRECAALLADQQEPDAVKFEWSDGILIDALQKGHWIVLDHANLCTSSVLDRLNSLLEPGGCLIVNEKLAADGQAHVVKPHADFRIFMTMDPRHGELSRAMRNRAIEMFISTSEEKISHWSDLPLRYGSESSMDRFRELQAIDLHSVPVSTWSGVFEEMFNRFSFHDHRVVQRWERSMQRGLGHLNKDKMASLRFAMDRVLQVVPSNDLQSEEGSTTLTTAYRHLEHAVGISNLSGASQPLHVLVNDPFVSVMIGHGSTIPFDFAWVYELRLQVAGLLLELTIHDTSAHKKRLPRTTDVRAKMTPPDLIKALTSSMWAALGVVLDRITQLAGVKDRLGPLRIVVSYGKDLQRLVHDENLETGVLQIYLKLGHSVCQDLKRLGSEYESVTEIVKVGLDHLDSWCKPTTGLSMERMWNDWRPITSSNEQQFKLMLDLEEAGHRFDALIWQVSVPVSDLSRIRESFTEARGSILLSVEGEEASLETLISAVKELESTIEEGAGNPLPHFIKEFSVLCQYQDLSEMNPEARPHLKLPNQNSLLLLAGRQSVSPGIGSNAVIPRIFSRYPLAVDAADESIKFSTVTGHVPMSILSQISSIASLPLAKMTLLAMELPELGMSYSLSIPELQTNTIDIFYEMLGSLLKHTLTSHRDFLNLPQPQGIEVSPSRPEYMLGFMANAISECLTVNSNHYFSGVATELLDQCVSHLHSSSPQSPNRLRNLGVAWIYLSLALIRLFVPDQPFDPSLTGVVERDRFEHRKEELEVKLQSLRIVEMNITGRDSNLRCRLVEDEINSLGPQPTPIPVYRPLRTKVPELQQEFNNLLYITVKKLTATNEDEPTTTLVRRLALGDVSSIEETGLILENVRRIQKRLLKNYREYDDLTVPVTWMTKCLDLGLELVRLESHQTRQLESSPAPRDTILYMAGRTPFLGGTPRSFLRPLDKVLEISTLGAFDRRLHYLSAFRVAINAGMQPLDTYAHRQNVLSTVHDLYQEWKAQLARDQEEATKKARTFHYRGQEDGDTGEEEELNAMFPTFQDSVNIPDLSPSPATIDSRESAIKLAEILSGMNVPQDNQLKLLEDYVLETTRHIGTVSGRLNKSIILNTEGFTGGVILALEKASNSIESASVSADTYNFYTDPNLVEVKRLLEVIGQTKARFQEVQSVWPEHATPKEVLGCCSELLAFKHTEPIAKFLTKAEKLHEFVYEWQSVASREFSASNIYDRLTDQLINWRRLELSAWAALLDNEDGKAKDDAKSWWFIAYETIIAMPLDLINSESGLGNYAEELSSTLENFLLATSKGQYCMRLQLIKNLQSFLERIAVDSTGLLPVNEAVAHFLAYYTRFEDVVVKNVITGRLRFEKDLKQQIKLASWKDTNISALRESARRSHHKLFKIVRKYRALLAQPINVSNVEVPPIHSIPVPTKDLDMTPPKVNQYALQLCSNVSQIWNQRPARFQDPERTALNMLNLYQSCLPTFSVPHEIESFTSELVEAIQILKKQTPTTLNEENKGFVSHLKSQKRKLVADTLKDLRNMGIRTNLGTEALSKQNSLSKVLANTPVLASKFMSRQSYETETYFHMFLNQVSQARQATRAPSDELAPHEVARGAGNVEGLLLLTLKQGIVLAPRLKALDTFDSTFQKIKSLTPTPSGSLSFEKEDSSESKQGARECVKWLPHIIDLGITVIRIQANFGQCDSNVVLEDLQRYKRVFENMAEEVERSPSMPLGVTLDTTTSFYEKQVKTLGEFRSELLQRIEEFPLPAFALRQVLKWTTYEKEIDSSQKTNSLTSFGITDVDQKLVSVMNSALVAIQEVVKAHEGAPVSAKDQAWLASSDKSSTASARALHLVEITSRIEEVFYMLQGFGDSNASTSECSLVGALFAVVIPILHQYQQICRDVLQQYLKLHFETCKMSFILTKAFVQLCKEGFCSPVDKSAGEQAESGKLETGTGLGDGEGAEDISKDVQDDEDLTELAEEPNKPGDKEEIEDEKDAVDMTMEDMEGEIGEGSENGEDDDDGDSGDEGEGDEIDDEIWSVDDLDPSAVDEKLWDGDGKEKEKESENQQGKGSTKDDLAAAQDQAKDGKQKEPEGMEGVEDDEDQASSGDEEGEAVGREEPGMTDPHVPEEETLNIPDEMQLDGDKNSDEGTDNEDLEVLSEETNEQLQDDLTPEQGGDLESASELGADDVDEEPAVEEIATADNREQDPSPDADDQPKMQEGPDDGTIMEEDYKEGDAEALAVADSTEVGSGPDQNLNAEQGQSGQAREDPANEEVSSQPQKEAPSSEGHDGQNTAELSTKGGRGDDSRETPQLQAFKKLGDALQQWHRQQQQIKDSSENNQTQQDTDMTGTDFEHLQHEDDAPDTQALGAATEEQARALDPSNAIEISEEQSHFLPDADETVEEEENRDKMEIEPNTRTPPKDVAEKGAFIGSDLSRDMSSRPQDIPLEPQTSEPIEETSTQLSAIHLNPAEPLLTTASEAQRLWAHYSSLTHPLSLTLTEQLRLILAPTLATKMRGDFRTGKRLNIKRIIPYIASQYRRDKIWMRRSVPSKRSYQIMLAVDDSKSMLESGSSGLAFETLALVAKALSALEVGDICIVGFGNEPHVRVTHEFGKPFTNEAGAAIFQHLSFQQTGTNVRQLVSDSLTLFRDARAKLASTAPSQTELWQLELIISDGICEDHDSIGKLVRQAQEERIMIVFIIVDNLAQASSAGAKGTSIMDLTQAIFEAGEDGAPGGGKLTMKRYLEAFPFGYYLVVRDVAELPAVLGGALKQWFAEVGDAR